ncbi:IS66 family insertion sequence element accessory protein TnpB [Streptococcus sp. 19428wA2_WM07]|nr:IS66 family insertion sequence element accessory protein TnpB [Streptococcus sp. 19428wA2_WM07]TFU28253.1 IS66 family insertion sequence element accessory protein TnpB [Streptococcus sp. WM07]
MVDSCSFTRINLCDLGRVHLITGKTDMRQGIDSLAYLVKQEFEFDPFSGQVFLFCGGRKDRFKALYWDGQGFWLLYKRFENGELNSDFQKHRVDDTLWHGNEHCKPSLLVFHRL